MCGYPVASAARKPLPLAAPVPSPPRYAGLPQYCTDFIVRADRDPAKDVFGARIGWTVTHSQSGYNAVRHHLAGRSASPEWVGPLVTPRAVIEAVLNDRIDVGPLDSYVHDLLERHEPGTAARLRVIESTVMAPIRARRLLGIDGKVAARLRHALLSCHAEPALAATRSTAARAFRGGRSGGLRYPGVARTGCRPCRGSETGNRTPSCPGIRAFTLLRRAKPLRELRELTGDDGKYHLKLNFDVRPFRHHGASRAS